MLKHYVTYLSPGSFFAETQTKLVNSRIPSTLSSVPKGIFGLYFFSREEEEKEGEVLKGPDKNKSALILLGIPYTEDQMRQKGYSEKDILFRNVFGNNYKYAVETMLGNWQIAEEKDIVISSPEELSQLTEAI